MDNHERKENPHQESKSGKLELIATQKFDHVEDTYKIIDFLNRNLKDHNLLFGLTKENDSMMISIYEVE